MIKISFRTIKKPLSTKTKRLYFLYFLFLWSLFLFLNAAVINSGLDTLFSQYSLVLINGTVLPRISVEIAPVVEEIIKLLGYSILFFIPLSSINKLEYHSKKEFLDKMMFPAFLISAGGFGFIEGIGHNTGVLLRCFPCFLPFVLLNILSHITFSIYPFFIGWNFRNWFVVFLPIGILLHAVHNFFIDLVWDNKWVSFIMITILLLPLLVLERKQLWRHIPFKGKQQWKNIIFVIGALGYLGIFLCCLFAF